MKDRSSNVVAAFSSSGERAQRSGTFDVADAGG